MQNNFSIIFTKHTHTYITNVWIMDKKKIYGNFSYSLLFVRDSNRIALKSWWKKEQKNHHFHQLAYKKSQILCCFLGCPESKLIKKTEICFFFRNKIFFLWLIIRMMMMKIVKKKLIKITILKSSGKKEDFIHSFYF